MGQIVKLKVCANSFEAQLLKTKLESEGINCMVTNENMGMLYGGLVDALNPRICVDEDDLERAQAVLEDVSDDQNVDGVEPE